MYFDVLMPTVLFLVTLGAVFLSRKAESKIKGMLEKREFRARDSLLLVAMIVVAVSVVVFVPDYTILAVFLFSYCSLLFMVAYLFSAMRRKRMVLYCGVFIVASVIAGVAAWLGVLPVGLRFYATLSFAGFAICAFFALLYATQEPAGGKEKWYLGALSPVLFLLLFFFYGGTPIWFPFLLDFYGILFALLIVLYLSSLFTWKTVFIFAAFLTAVDIILVWGTGTMVEAAKAVSGLGLPVLVAFPTVPFIFANGVPHFTLLGLGDFFFAGILGTQTLKKFGQKTSVLSLLTMSISFALFELILLNPELAQALPFRALPATLPIILGWMPVVGIKMLIERSKKKSVSQLAPQEYKQS